MEDAKGLKIYFPFIVKPCLKSQSSEEKPIHIWRILQGYNFFSLLCLFAGKFLLPLVGHKRMNGYRSCRFQWWTVHLQLNSALLIFRRINSPFLGKSSVMFTLRSPASWPILYSPSSIKQQIGILLFVHFFCLSPCYQVQFVLFYCSWAMWLFWSQPGPVPKIIKCCCVPWHERISKVALLFHFQTRGSLPLKAALQHHSGEIYQYFKRLLHLFLPTSISNTEVL